VPAEQEIDIKCGSGTAMHAHKTACHPNKRPGCHVPLLKRRQKHTDLVCELKAVDLLDEFIIGTRSFQRRIPKVRCCNRCQRGTG